MFSSQVWNLLQCIFILVTGSVLSVATLSIPIYRLFTLKKIFRRRSPEQERNASTFVRLRQQVTGNQQTIQAL